MSTKNIYTNNSYNHCRWLQQNFPDKSCISKSWKDLGFTFEYH